MPVSNKRWAVLTFPRAADPYRGGDHVVKSGFENVAWFLTRGEAAAFCQDMEAQFIPCAIIVPKEARGLSAA